MIQEHGTPFSVTAAGTGTTSALYSGTSGQLIFVTDISVSSTGTTSGTWALYAGNSIVWQGAGPTSQRFSEPIRIGSNVNASLNASGVGNTYASISGFYIKVS